MDGPVATPSRHTHFLSERKRTTQRCLLMLLLLLCGSISWASLLPNPRITSVFPAGGQQGTTVTVNVQGQDLHGVRELIFSHPGITAAVRPSENDATPPKDGFHFNVTISPDVPPDVYEVRGLGRDGLSAPRLFRVGDLPELNCDGLNTSPEKAMTVPVGSIVNSPRGNDPTVHYYEIDCEAGKRILIRCDARGIDSRMMPVLEVWNPEGGHIATARATQTRPAQIELVPPTSGKFRLSVNDITYRGGDASPYRLEVSTRPVIWGIWPPTAPPGSTGTFTLYGTGLPNGKPVEGDTTPPGLQEIQLPISIPRDPIPFSQSTLSLRFGLPEGAVTGFEHRLPGESPAADPVWISEAQAPVLLEQESNNRLESAQPLSLPCEVTGRFRPGKDVAWYTFHARQGETISIRVFSERLNLPTDPQLTLFRINHDDQGGIQTQQVAVADDLTPSGETAPFHSRSLDPELTFTADGDGHYALQVRNLVPGNLADFWGAYRMLIRPVRPDFEIVAAFKELGRAPLHESPQRAQAPILRRGGTLPILIQATRIDGFSGPIDVQVEGLPGGVEAPKVTLPAGTSQGVLMLQASKDAEPWTGPMTITGFARIGEEDRRNNALPSSIHWERRDAGDLAAARILKTMMLSVINEPAPLSMTLTSSSPLETCRGATPTVNLEITPHTEIKGPMTLELRGLPVAQYPLDQLPRVEIEAAATTAQLAFPIKPGLPAGDYPCYVVLTTKAMHTPQPFAETDPPATPTEVDVYLASPLVVLRVAATPVLLTAPEQVGCAAGEAVELPVQLERRYGFDGSATVELSLPADASGVKVTPVTIASTETGQRLRIETSADAPAREIAARLITRVNFGGQELTSEQPVTLQIRGATP